MPKFYIEYRGEFASEVEVNDKAGAMKKFAQGGCTIEVMGDLNCQHFQISEVHRVKRGGMKR